LECFWILHERPTGSKDPYALRRAALGVVRIILEKNIRVALRKLLYWAAFPIFGYLYWTYAPAVKAVRQLADIPRLIESEHVEAAAERVAGAIKAFDENKDIVPGWEGLGEDNAAALLLFIADRLKVQLREQGARHDLVDAVFALEGQDDLVLVVRRVEALGKFLDTDDGKNLLAGFKRAANILRIEEKKDARDYVGKPDPQYYRQDEEWALARAIDAAKQEAGTAVAREDFAAAMRAMAKLRPHVDAFFEKVTVNVAEGD